MTGLVISGYKQENMTVKFNTEHFLSTEGTSLYHDLVWGHPNKIPIPPAIVAIMGGTSDVIMKTSIVGIVAINQLAGGSAALMWGALNTIQIITFFPLL